MPDWASTRDAILGDRGESLLQLMREVFFGRAASSPEQSDVSTALQLGWISKGSNGTWRLTPHGGHVADSAREYCNWLDDKRQLPSQYGLTDADVAGKTVLDIGCGFGRHVFSASRTAALAVGLEAGQAYIQMSSILRSREGITSAMLTCGDGEKLPFADGVFDIIMCTRALPYMDATIALPEFARVLRVGGRAYMLVSTFQLFIDDLIGRPQQPFSVREKLGHVKKMINSLWLSWSGKPLFRRNSKSTTGTYYLFTARRLLQMMENAGLRLVHRSAPDELFIVERVR